MTKKYRLVGKNRAIIKDLEISIDESAKEDFKELMGWNEMDFRFNTELIEEKK